MLEPINKIDDKKTIRAWTFYDWANSTYNLLINSAIFPIYYTAIIKTDKINIFGYDMAKEAAASYAISLAYLIIMFISPVLSALADYKGNKKTYMKIFCYLGAIACMAMYFFKKDTITGNVNYMFGLVCSTIACIGYCGSLVFYNAYLPEIASKEKQDVVSAKGFSMGYIGSVILMILSLVFILTNDAYHYIKDATLPTRISFVFVGLWWAGFAQIPFRILKDQNTNLSTEHINIVQAGYQKLADVWNKISHNKTIVLYLLSFLFITMGVQTIMFMATYFAAKEIKMESSQLITTILLIQLVGIAGAYLFAKVSEKFSNKTSLIIMLLLWIVVCIAAAFYVYTVYQFYALAFLVGLIMGGTQATARATYSKLLPQTTDTASFFSFYDVVEKLGIVLGTASFGFIADTMGMRMSAVGLGSFFIIGIVVLYFTPMKKIIGKQ